MNLIESIRKIKEDEQLITEREGDWQDSVERSVKTLEQIVTNLKASLKNPPRKNVWKAIKKVYHTQLNQVSAILTNSNLAESLQEGTWAIPDDKHKMRALRTLMKKPLKAKGAEEKLQDLVGNDDLFDEIDWAIKNNPEMDVRIWVMDWVWKNLKIKV